MQKGSVNKVILVGHLGGDPESRFTPGGTADESNGGSECQPPIFSPSHLSTLIMYPPVISSPETSSTSSLEIFTLLLSLFIFSNITGEIIKAIIQTFEEGELTPTFVMELEITELNIEPLNKDSFRVPKLYTILLL